MALYDTLLVSHDALRDWDDGRTFRTFAAAMRKIADGTATAEEALATAQQVSE
jgi:hypothetical protein